MEKKKFTVGEKVNHAIYGKGTVVKVTPRVDYYPDGKVMRHYSDLIVVNWDDGKTREDEKEIHDGTTTYYKRYITKDFIFNTESLLAHCIPENIMEDPEEVK